MPPRTEHDTDPAPDDAFGEFRLTVGGHACVVLHRRALVSWFDEQTYLSTDEPRQYGMVLWPASIALALEIASRAVEFRGRRVLELGAGVGLAGIAAAAVGAQVLQTDRDEQALALCERNARRSGVVTHTSVADWTDWPHGETYDWVIGADILYRSTLHDQLRDIFERSVAPDGGMLIADPLRSASVRLLERLEQDRWSVRMSKWAVGEGEEGRTIGVMELRRRAR